MKNLTSIEVNNLNKIYKLYDSATDRFLETFNPIKKTYHKEFYALKNVSFSISRGEIVGIIGTNGSGKSTLLKILSGVLHPTGGSIKVNGKISALLELGAGFNLEYNGIDNIYLNCSIMGYSKDEIKLLLPRIVEFADIGDFINQPVKTYSSGMFVRLAFATQIFSNPDILIVDEALSVGDMRFQQKCYRAMDNMMKEKTVIIVSHDSSAIAKFCSRVIWINQGEIIYDGNVEEGLKRYQSFLLNNTGIEGINNSTVHAETENIVLKTLDVPSDVEKAGTGAAKIVKCGLFNNRGEIINIVDCKEKYIFAMDVIFKEKIKNCIVGLTVKDRLGNVMFAINTCIIDKNVDSDSLQCQYQFKMKFPSLNHGEYTISPAIAVGNMEQHKQICWLHDATIFSVKMKEYRLPGFLYVDDVFDVFIHEQ